MRLPKLNWAIVIGVLFLTTALLYIAYSTWQFRAIRTPLLDSLNQISGVSNVQLVTKQHQISLRIGVHAEANFPALASQINQLLQQALPGRSVEIVWEDHPTGKLLQLRDQLNLILGEAQRRHEYVLMAERVEEVINYPGVSYQIGVDADNIYIRLQDEAGDLLEALPVSNFGGVER